MEFYDQASQQLPYIDRLNNYLICLRSITRLLSASLDKNDMDKQMEQLEQMLDQNDKAIEVIRQMVEKDLVSRLTFLESL
jgi:hypothetical protein